MTYGVLPQGFVLKPLAVILQDIEQDELSTIAADLLLSPEEPLGQLNGIFASKISDVWELANFLYNNTNRGAAQGDQLDNIGTLEGTIREGPTPSTVYATLTFSLAGTYAGGALVAFLPAASSIQFSNATTITAPSIVNGNPISAGNPYVATDVLMQSTQNGPDFGQQLIGFGIGHLTGQVPVTGWLSVVDTSGPTLGTLEENDPDYRIRQVRELADVGASSPEAIRAAVEHALTQPPASVPAPIVIVYENLTMFVNAQGLPAKSFMAVVFDGLNPNVPQNNPLIAAAIWKQKPAGIATFGTTTVTTLDSQGSPQAISFSRPTQVPVFMTISVAIAANASPAAVQALVVEAVIAASQGQPFLMFGQQVVPDPDAATTLLPGKDVIAMAFRAIALGQAGVLDVPALTLDVVPAPTATANIRVPLTSIAIITTATLVVQTSTFVP